MVAAVIRDPASPTGRVLVGLRPAGKRHGGRWEFPGGKVEPGESVAGAMERELMEELGVRVRQVGAVLHEAADPGSPYLIRFLQVEVEGTPRALEHDEVRFVSREEARALPLAPADRGMVESMRPSGRVPDR